MNVLKKLTKSAESGLPVRIYRNGIEDAYMDAYVLRVTSEWVLLEPVRDRVDLDGYDVIRVADVSSVAKCPRSEFYEIALALKNMKVKVPRGIWGDDISVIIRNVCDRYPLVVIHRELVRPDACEIGRVYDISGRTYRLHWINPDAVFEEDGRRFRLSDVTRIQFGGSYENTLAKVSEWRLGKGGGKRQCYR